MPIVDVSPDAGLIPWLLGGLAQLILAVWVYRLAPDKMRHRTFAVFLVLNGSWDVVVGLALRSQTMASFHLFARLQEHLHVWTTLALVAFLGHYPRTRAVARSRWFLPILGVLGIATTVAFLSIPDLIQSPPASSGAEFFFLTGGPVRLLPSIDEVLVLWTLLALWKFHRGGLAEADVSRLLVPMALLSYPLVFAGGLWSTFGPEAFLDPLAYVGPLPAIEAFYVRRLTIIYVAALALAPAIVISAARHPDGGPRLAGFLAALAATGLLVGAYLPGFFGITAFLFAAIVAYALARHQLLDVEAKLRFGVSRSTLAGFFIAVFFIVSEAAQILFAGFAGSEILGVIAAGLLVFAISPLQRLADRFAAKAVPGGAEAGTDTEERYKAFVELALADGKLSREEERQLAKRAANLGIDADRAFELREKVEDERGGGDPP